MLTRDAIRAGWIQEIVASAAHPVRALSAEELAASREAALAGHPRGASLALFAYGSLIWNPAFHFTGRELARVHGLHRRFCLWTHLGRGTPDRPGLVLGLDSGGSCRGVLFQIAADEVETELDIVWRREMVTGAYRPSWVTAHTDEGPRRALTFVINRRHERYSGKLGDAAVVDAIATACGPLGACADYLFNTAAHLEQLGIDDPRLQRLCRLVRARQLAEAEAPSGTPADPALA